MPDYTISSGDYIRPYRSPGGSPPLRSAPEAASQVYLTGDVLQMTDGTVERASTSGSTLTSITIAGVAAEPASSVTGTKRLYFTARPNTEFWARTRGGVTASSNVGAVYGMFRDSSKNVWLVDLGNATSTGGRVIVTECVDSTGSSGGAVAFAFGTYNSTVVPFVGHSA